LLRLIAQELLQEPLVQGVDKNSKEYQELALPKILALVPPAQKYDFEAILKKPLDDAVRSLIDILHVSDIYDIREGNMANRKKSLECLATLKAAHDIFPSLEKEVNRPGSNISNALDEVGQLTEDKRACRLMLQLLTNISQRPLLELDLKNSLLKMNPKILLELVTEGATLKQDTNSNNSSAQQAPPPKPVRNIAPAKSVDELKPKLSSNNWPVRVEAVASLGLLLSSGEEHSGGSALLMSALLDEEWNVRREAVVAIGHQKLVHDDQYIRALSNMMRVEEDRDVKLSVAKVLNELANKS